MSNSANTSPTDQNIQISDVTTNNTSTTKHGFTPKYPNDATKYLDGTGAYSVPAGSATGTVTSVSVTTANGVSGTVATATTTPAISLTLGAITPTSIGTATTATTQTPADNSTKLATTAYVDNAILGQRTKEAVKYASIAVLPSIVYANGSSGVGATLTGVALGAISLDSSSPSVADRVLIKNQVSDFQNGIYIVTAAGSGAAVFVLTRATDFDQASDIQTGDTVFVTAGNTLANTTWTYNGIDSPTMGTTSLTFAQAAGPGSFTGGNGITITGTSIAINTAVTADLNTSQALTNKTYNGNTFTAGTGVLTIGASKTLTASSTFTLTGTDGKGINVGAATSGKILIGDGTNMVLSTSTIPTSAGSTANKVLLSDGTNYVLSTPTFPNASATSGKFIRSDGTNWIASTPTLPTSAGTSGKLLQSDGTNYIETTPTYPNSATTSKILVGDGTNIVLSTPTFPNASATSGKIIKSDGTNWVASTETYAAPGSSGNLLTSDGTNWTSAAAGGAGAMTLLHAAKGTNTSTSANTVDSIALSGLTQLDTIVIYFNCRQITQDNGNGISFYSSTDATILGRLSADGAMSAGQVMGGTVTLRCDQNSTTTYNMFTVSVINNGNSTTGTTSALTNLADKTFTTAWTSPWTLALHSDGMTSGGTLRYNWSVYKVAGQ